MANEYIERTALGIGKCNPEIFESKEYAKGWNSAIEIIENAPTADVAEVVHGEWKDNTGPLDSARQYKCSICGKAPIFSYTWTNILSNYCPNCGAKMDGKKVE